MDEHIKESVNKMCSFVGENNTNDFLMVNKNLFTESEEIQSQNNFKNNLSEDDEDDDKEEVFQ